MNAYRRGTVLGLTIAETFHSPYLPSAHCSAGPCPAGRAAPGARHSKLAAGMGASGRDRDPTAERRPRRRRGRRGRMKAEEKAEQARAAAERERDQAHEMAEQARKAQEKAQQARAAAERERDQAHDNGRGGSVRLRRKPSRLAPPPNGNATKRDVIWRYCGARVRTRRVGITSSARAREGKTREKPYYVFNVAIYEDSIELAPRTPPQGGASDDRRWTIRGRMEAAAH